MRVKVDAKRCQGHAMCAQQAPEVFELDGDQGHAHVVIGNVPKDLEERVLRAVSNCPEQAISVDE